MTDNPPPDLSPPEDLSPAEFRAFLKARQGDPNEPLEEVRARIDRQGLAIPLPEGCSLAHLDAGGVPCEGLTPATAREGRLVIYLHGGGFAVCSPRSVRHFVARLAGAAGAPALTPQYRLAPENPFPAALEDALAVYRWALDRLPPERIAFAGNSAGAGLSLAAALAARDQGLPPPACLYLICPWADLVGAGASYAAKAQSDIFVSAPMLATMRDGYLAGADPNDPRASPARGDLSGLGPMLIQVGSEEILLSDSTALAERAGLAKVQVRLEVAPEMLHDFPHFHRQLATGRMAIAEAGAWLAERLDQA